MEEILNITHEDGTTVQVLAAQTRNQRGRVIESTLRVLVDDEVVYEGPDTPEADAEWKPFLAAEDTHHAN